MSLTNDAADPVGSYLISPGGDTLGYGQNVNPITGVSSLSSTAYTHNPVPGIWTLIVDFAEPVVGNEISQPFTGNIRFNQVRASASGLPNSGSIHLPAGTSVTVPVTITNNGAAPEAFFIDPRLNTTTILGLASLSSDTVNLPMPSTAFPPVWLVPTETSSVSVSQSSSLPAMFTFFVSIGDPDIASATTGSLCSTTAIVSFTPPGGTVTAGIWYAQPSECGPYPGPAPTGAASIAMTAQSKAFDPAVTSDTGDFWPTSINLATTFSPIILNPGQTGTINVAITPSGASGTVVRGTLYVDDFATGTPTNYLYTESGDELAAFPYSYTIK